MLLVIMVAFFLIVSSMPPAPESCRQGTFKELLEGGFPASCEPVVEESAP